MKLFERALEGNIIAVIDDSFTRHRLQTQLIWNFLKQTQNQYIVCIYPDKNLLLKHAPSIIDCLISFAVEACRFPFDQEVFNAQARLFTDKNSLKDPLLDLDWNFKSAWTVSSSLLIYVGLQKFHAALIATEGTLGEGLHWLGPLLTDENPEPGDMAIFWPRVSSSVRYDSTNVQIFFMTASRCVTLLSRGLIDLTRVSLLTLHDCHDISIFSSYGTIAGFFVPMVPHKPRVVGMSVCPVNLPLRTNGSMPYLPHHDDIMAMLSKQAALYKAEIVFGRKQYVLEMDCLRRSEQIATIYSKESTDVEWKNIIYASVLQPWKRLIDRKWEIEDTPPPNVQPNAIPGYRPAEGIYARHRNRFLHQLASTERNTDMLWYLLYSDKRSGPQKTSSINLIRMISGLEDIRLVLTGLALEMQKELVVPEPTIHTMEGLRSAFPRLLQAAIDWTPGNRSNLARGNKKFFDKTQKSLWMIVDEIGVWGVHEQMKSKALSCCQTLRSFTDAAATPECEQLREISKHKNVYISDQNILLNSVSECLCHDAAIFQSSNGSVLVVNDDEDMDCEIQEVTGTHRESSTRAPTTSEFGGFDPLTADNSLLRKLYAEQIKATDLLKAKAEILTEMIGRQATTAKEPEKEVLKYRLRSIRCDKWALWLSAPLDKIVDETLRLGQLIGSAEDIYPHWTALTDMAVRGTRYDPIRVTRIIASRLALLKSLIRKCQSWLMVVLYEGFLARHPRLISGLRSVYNIPARSTLEQHKITTASLPLISNKMLALERTLRSNIFPETDFSRPAKEPRTLEEGEVDSDIESVSRPSAPTGRSYWIEEHLPMVIYTGSKEAESCSGLTTTLGSQKRTIIVCKEAMVAELVHQFIEQRCLGRSKLLISDDCCGTFHNNVKLRIVERYNKRQDVNTLVIVSQAAFHYDLECCDSLILFDKLETMVDMLKFTALARPVDFAGPQSKTYIFQAEIPHKTLPGSLFLEFNEICRSVFSEYIESSAKYAKDHADPSEVSLKSVAQKFPPWISSQLLYHCLSTFSKKKDYILHQWLNLLPSNELVKFKQGVASLHLPLILGKSGSAFLSSQEVDYHLTNVEEKVGREIVCEQTLSRLINAGVIDDAMDPIEPEPVQDQVVVQSQSALDKIRDARKTSEPIEGVFWRRLPRELHPPICRAQSASLSDSDQSAIRGATDITHLYPHIICYYATNWSSEILKSGGLFGYWRLHHNPDDFNNPPEAFLEAVRAAEAAENEFRSGSKSVVAYSPPNIVSFANTQLDSLLTRNRCEAVVDPCTEAEEFEDFSSVSSELVIPMNRRKNEICLNDNSDVESLFVQAARESRAIYFGQTARQVKGHKFPGLDISPDGNPFCVVQPCAMLLQSPLESPAQMVVSHPVSCETVRIVIRPILSKSGEAKKIKMQRLHLDTIIRFNQETNTRWGVTNFKLNKDVRDIDGQFIGGSGGGIPFVCMCPLDKTGSSLDMPYIRRYFRLRRFGESVSKSDKYAQSLLELFTAITHDEAKSYPFGSDVESAGRAIEGKCLSKLKEAMDDTGFSEAEISDCGDFNEQSDLYLEIMKKIEPVLDPQSKMAVKCMLLQMLSRGGEHICLRIAHGTNFQFGRLSDIEWDIEAESKSYMGVSLYDYYEDQLKVSVNPANWFVVNLDRVKQGSRISFSMEKLGEAVKVEAHLPQILIPLPVSEPIVNQFSWLPAIFWKLEVICKTWEFERDKFDIFGGRDIIESNLLREFLSLAILAPNAHFKEDIQWAETKRSLAASEAICDWLLGRDSDACEDNTDMQLMSSLRVPFEGIDFSAIPQLVDTLVYVKACEYKEMQEANTPLYHLLNKELFWPCLASYLVDPIYSVGHNQVLEFVGDAILKYIAGVWAFFTNVDRDEGVLSTHADLIKANYSLSAAFRSEAFYEYVLTRPFRKGKEQRASLAALKSQTLSLKQQADYVESFVGSMYYSHRHKFDVWPCATSTYFSNILPHSDPKLLIPIYLSSQFCGSTPGAFLAAGFSDVIHASIGLEAPSPGQVFSWIQMRSTQKYNPEMLRIQTSDTFGLALKLNQIPAIPTTTYLEERKSVNVEALKTARDYIDTFFTADDLESDFDTNLAAEVADLCSKYNLSPRVPNSMIESAWFRYLPNPAKKFSKHARKLLCCARIHPSANTLINGLEDYQRLEFVGDSVLGLCVTEWLTKLLPKAREGNLTHIKSALLSNRFLCRALLGRTTSLDCGDIVCTEILYDIRNVVDERNYATFEKYIRRHTIGEDFKIIAVRIIEKTSDIDNDFVVKVAKVMGDFYEAMVAVTLFEYRFDVTALWQVIKDDFIQCEPAIMDIYDTYGFNV